MKKILLDNQVILDALIKKDKMTNEINQLAKDEEALVAKANKLMAKLAKENEKVLPLIKEELTKLELEEFEELSRTYLGKEGEEEGKAFMEIANRLEEFKDSFKKQRDESNNSSDTTKGDGQGNDNTEESTKGDKNDSSKG